MSHLILVRHGQSVWNLENRFTGWVDVNLTPKGKLEACKAGELIRGKKIEIRQKNFLYLYFGLYRGNLMQEIQKWH